ncbi:MAG TPA: hypothetical protein VK448_01380 [Dissulfurispiraceae bacterium]|nr:hypothetical protein [Dissulfurispiraceae bacterium]
MKYVSPVQPSLAGVFPEMNPATPQESFSSIFASELRSMSVAPAARSNAKDSTRIVPSIVNIPIKQAPAASGSGSSRMNSDSIDIARIVNFVRPGQRAATAPLNDGTILSTSGNPSVVISGRSHTPSAQWDRYRMGSAPQDSKGSSFAAGVMVAFRV